MFLFEVLLLPVHRCPLPPKKKIAERKSREGGGCLYTGWARRDVAKKLEYNWQLCWVDSHTNLFQFNSLCAKTLQKRGN